MFELKDQSPRLGAAVHKLSLLIDFCRHEFITPEGLLWAIFSDDRFTSVFGNDTRDSLMAYIDKYVPRVPETAAYRGAEPSTQFVDMANKAYLYKASSGAKFLEVSHIIKAILDLEEDSFAKSVLLALCEGDTTDLMYKVVRILSDNEVPDYTDGVIDEKDYEDLPFGDYDSDYGMNPKGNWLDYVTLINERIADHNPLIGRRHELDRTIQILCRKDKNNPLHVGEPGVGKTAIAYGLAAMIERGEVPHRLEGCKIYELDLGALLAGTQYRGDMEARIKEVLKKLEEQGNAILYIDEIHTIIGAGRVSESAIDASNMLKRSLEQGNIRFMGATTYDEYKKYFLRSKGFSRRFEKIDVPEPSVDECVEILRGLRKSYEDYHNVRYTDEAIDFAAKGAHKFINGKFLPDKAIDLIDEAGAWMQAHPVVGEEGQPVRQVVDKKVVADVLAKVCNVETLADDADEYANLESLESTLKSHIYRQDTAIREVTEAIQLGAAGLTDDNKPLASLLFVGPTGVGKTEVAKVLARQLGIPLLRFDMSEYAEKHTVAKLIGAPAGYVGYDDGGLLTDAIRKSPHCVLLFDELEKAHSDIYNILLQVMDYASLTDSKGQKADFRHVIFIMTTNSGAQEARQAHLGFVSGASAGQVMMKSVKRTFKPEFLNRLSAITIFNDMDREMAQMILDKKLRQLSVKLAQKNVELHLDDAALALLLDKGYSHEYGGREVERAINTLLKPMLMREILFGSLRGGGHANVSADGDTLRLIPDQRTARVVEASADL